MQIFDQILYIQIRSNEIQILNKNEIRNVRVDRKIAIYIKCKYYYIYYVINIQFINFLRFNFQIFIKSKSNEYQSR